MNDLIDSIRFDGELEPDSFVLNNLEMIDCIIQEIEQSCTDAKFQLQKSAKEPTKIQFLKSSTSFIQELTLLTRKILILEAEIQKQLDNKTEIRKLVAEKRALENKISYLHKECHLLDIASQVEIIKSTFEAQILENNLSGSLQSILDLERVVEDPDQQLLMFIIDGKSKISKALLEAFPRMISLSITPNKIEIHVLDEVDFGFEDSKSKVPIFEVFNCAKALGLMKRFQEYYTTLLSHDILPWLLGSDQFSFDQNESSFSVSKIRSDSCYLEDLFCFTIAFLNFSNNKLVGCNNIGSDFDLDPLWEEIGKVIQKHMVAKAVRVDYNEAKALKQSALNLFETFKSESRHLNLNYRLVEQSIEGLLDSFIANRGKALRQKALAIIPQLYSNVITQTKESKGFFRFPSCSIHAGAQHLVHMVDDIEKESNAYETCFIDYSFTTRDILDYLIANFVLILQKKSSNPLTFMIYHNDCQYIGFKCQLWHQVQANKYMTEKTVVDFTLRFQNMGIAFFNSVIDTQTKILKEIIKKADGLHHMESNPRMQKVNIMVEQLSHLMTHLSEKWTAVLPIHVQFIALGKMIDKIAEFLSEEIFKLRDISEVESERLAGVLNLSVIESLFNADGHCWIGHYSTKYGHFKTLLQILTWSFASIMEHFSLGALVDFEVDQLTHLVKALFSDTPLRRKNLDILGKGHPV